MEETQRKEITLTKSVIANLQSLANNDKRKLKPYMEKVLEDHSKKVTKIKKPNA